MDVDLVVIVPAILFNVKLTFVSSSNLLIVSTQLCLVTMQEYQVPLYIVPCKNKHDVSRN